MLGPAAVIREDIAAISACKWDLCECQLTYIPETLIAIPYAVILQKVSDPISSYTYVY